MNTETKEAIHHLAMVLQMRGPVAMAVARSGDAGAVADMIIAQKLLRKALKRHAIPCNASLGS